MKIITDLTEYLPCGNDTSLTIGNFDGVHLGHQGVLNRMKGRKVVLSFSNHPSEVLRPDQPVAKLCTLDHKIKLLGNYGVDDLLLLNFTNEFSQLSPEAFLEMVRSHCPFSELILGPDASFGKNRQGNREKVEVIARSEGYALEYIEEYNYGGEKVSSSRIRKFLQQGDLRHVEELLGRKYSIYTEQISGLGLGKRIGFPTINIDVAGLCLPPFGVYAVTLLHDNDQWKGVANLGFAPTIRHNNKPILEVHLLEQHEEFSKGNHVEVVLHKFIRPEKTFASVEALKEQIAQDVQTAHKHLIT